MALFGKTEEEKKDDVVAEEATATDQKTTEQEAPVTAAPMPVVDGHEDLARVLKQPRITEKATMGTDQNVYVFDVAPDANKKQIKEAVKLVYDVDAVKVHVTKVPSKNVRNARTGKKGVKSGGKKAYVYLKKGETISIM